MNGPAASAENNSRTMAGKARIPTDILKVQPPDFKRNGTTRPKLVEDTLR